MTNTAGQSSVPGWTGGQYSLLRAASGVVLAVLPWLGGPNELAAQPTAARAAASGLALAFALGIADRLAALGLLVLGVTLTTRQGLESEGLAALLAVLIAHLLVPSVPYGSLAARGRLDPGGGWSMPTYARRVLRVLLGALYAAVAFAEFRGGEPWSGAAHVVALFVFGPRAVRPWAWAGFLVFVAAWSSTRGSGPTGLALFAAHLFLFEPAWLPGRRGEGPALLFYDGHCGLCHRAVRFVLAEDPEGLGFRFAPLQGARFERTVPAEERSRLPDSLVLVTASGELLTKAPAFHAQLEAFGGWWRVVSAAARVVPLPLRQAAYDLVARMRLSIFGRRDAACPLLTPELARRFDLEG